MPFLKLRFNQNCVYSPFKGYKRKKILQRRLYKNNQLSFPTFLILGNSELVSFLAKTKTEDRIQPTARHWKNFGRHSSLIRCGYRGKKPWSLVYNAIFSKNKKVISPFAIWMFVSVILVCLSAVCFQSFWSAHYEVWQRLGTHQFPGNKIQINLKNKIIKIKNWF